MLGWITQLRQRWADWCGDRELEVAIRKHLSERGFFGPTARIKNVRLVAVQRPGWLQVYRFEVTVRVRPPEESDDLPDAEPEYRELFGLVKDDIRYNVHTVNTFPTESERRELFAVWSEDLICLRGAHGLISPNQIS
jgi:hypothetical protein